MSTLFKDLYDENYLSLLSKNIKKFYDSFDENGFKKAIFNKLWKDKELKQRMRHISLTLGSFLSKDYEENIGILKKTFSQMNYDYSLENMIFQDFVEVYGIDNFNISMDALKHFTINSSSEFAIRRFIIKYPKESLNIIKEFVKDEDEHIRRLVSEGIRPRLPWAITLEKFKKEPKEVLEILELLLDDESKYVQKSVANNLNDISKDNPKILIKFIKKHINKSKNINWILKHGSRTLLKTSNIEVLKLFGYQNISHINLSNFQVSNSVNIAEDLDFSFVLSSKKDLGKLRVEYAIEFVRLKDKSSKKVFKIAESDYKIKQKEFKKTYSFRKITTRKYYAGIHTLFIIINGEVLAQKKFNLGETK